MLSYPELIFAVMFTLLPLAVSPLLYLYERTRGGISNEVMQCLLSCGMTYFYLTECPSRVMFFEYYLVMFIHLPLDWHWVVSLFGSCRWCYGDYLYEISCSSRYGRNAWLDFFFLTVR